MDERFFLACFLKFFVKALTLPLNGMVKSLDTDMQNAKKGEDDNDVENFWSNEGRFYGFKCKNSFESLYIFVYICKFIIV